MASSSPPGDEGQLDWLARADAGPLSVPNRSSDSPQKIRPAQVPPEVAALAEEIGPGTRYGTSTWSYPGWANIVYDETVATKPSATIAKAGLPAYCAHPLLGAVGLDRTHYGPLQADAYAAMATQTPEAFRFVVKAHEACSLQSWPYHPRYGTRKGEKNPLFLDAEYASEVVAQKIQGFASVAGGPSRLGCVLFQFAPQDVTRLGGPGAFARRVAGFLARLPPGPQYAVEVRNPELQTEDLAKALHDVGAIVCLTILPQLRGPFAQAKTLMVKEAPAALVRWMVPRDTTYEEAKERFLPYAKMKAPAPSMRNEVARVVLACERAEKPCTVIINNLAEGSAPRSVAALLGEIRQLRKRLGEG